MKVLARRAVAPFVGAGARAVAAAKKPGGAWNMVSNVLAVITLAMIAVAVWLVLRPSPKPWPARVSKSETGASADGADGGLPTLIMKIVPPDAGSPSILAKPRPLALAANAGPPTIIVDPGHGGNDDGARRNGLYEKDLTLDTALRLELKLRVLGFPVVLTRREDRRVELSERSEVANRYPRALFVSIHFNDFGSSAGQGVETFYASDKVPELEAAWYFSDLFPTLRIAPPADNGMAFARIVQTASVKALGVQDRGVKAARLAVVRHSRCAAVLVEGGFINNPAQAREIGTLAYREKLADGIAEGIASYHRLCVEEEKLRLSRGGE